MNIGDYVRDDGGSIGKIIHINNEGQFEVDNGWLYDDGDIEKISPNIIDLLEVGDLLYIDISPDNCGGIVVPRIPETQYELDCIKNEILLGNEELRGIITKEQLESMVYKI